MQTFLQVPADPGGVVDVQFDDDHGNDYFDAGDIDNHSDNGDSENPTSGDNPSNGDIQANEDNPSVSIDINDNVAETVTVGDGDTAEEDEVVLRKEGRRRKDCLADLVRPKVLKSIAQYLKSLATK